MLQPNLVGLQGRQPTQLHLQNGIGLGLAQPEFAHQALPGTGGIGRGTDQGDDGIEIVEGNQQPQQDVVTLFGLAQQITGAPLDGLDAEIEEHLQHFAQGQQHRLAVYQRQHVGIKIILKRRQFKEIIEHNLRVGIAAQFDDNAHAIAVAFIADIGNTF